MRIGIVGTGTIGQFLLRQLKDDKSFEVAAVHDMDTVKASQVLKELGYPGSLLMPLAEFPQNIDVIVEAASGDVANEVAVFALERGAVAVIASAGGLGDIGPLEKIASETGGQLIVPSGAIAGLDALKAIPSDSIISVRLKTTKPASTLADSKYLKELSVDTLGFTQATRIFSGTARDAAKAFPKSINVAASLAHATIGLDRTMVEIWADPDGEMNIHNIRVESGHGIISSETMNVPFEDNPRTSRLAAWSILATIRGLSKPVVIGT